MPLHIVSEMSSFAFRERIRHWRYSRNRILSKDKSGSNILSFRLIEDWNFSNSSGTLRSKRTAPKHASALLKYRCRIDASYQVGNGHFICGGVPHVPMISVLPASLWTPSITPLL
ncbi:MAG: hypothetical protein IPN15_20100 [Saprospiraceae bacterium]|nr:hypothetical protein [Candidatus Vicinibacter affinis]